ncbi:hypothetical protein LIER_10828 [Lithospermum erythrorhizon]|uniref:non-specific serine/threonine protein kinase n=1 Tax=Lithospermum erythrorhizon TaxID=34254 RepID=A0AAV3PKM8_LITER
MKQTNQCFVTLCLTLHVVLVVLLGVPCSCVDEYYELCVTQRCSAGPNISYPFRIPTETSNYCGYPGFELNCSSFGYPLLRLHDQDYVVEDIPMKPIQQDRTYSYLHFLSGCNMSMEAMVSDIERYEIGCSNEKSGLVMYDEDQNLEKALEGCGGFDKNNVKNEYEDVMKKGFELTWLVSDCKECRASGGRCGYNVNTYHFECFCTDRPHSATCQPSKSYNFFI